MLRSEAHNLDLEATKTSLEDQLQAGCKSTLKSRMILIALCFRELQYHFVSDAVTVDGLCA